MHSAIDEDLFHAAANCTCSVLWSSLARAYCWALATQPPNRTACISTEGKLCKLLSYPLSFVPQEKVLIYISFSPVKEIVLQTSFQNTSVLTTVDLQTPKYSLNGYLKCLSELYLGGMQVWELYSHCRILTSFTQLTLALWFSSLNIFDSEEQMCKLNFGSVHQSPIPEDIY